MNSESQVMPIVMFMQSATPWRSLACLSYIMLDKLKNHYFIEGRLINSLAQGHFYEVKFPSYFISLVIVIYLAYQEPLYPYCLVTYIVYTLAMLIMQWFTYHYNLQDIKSNSSSFTILSKQYTIHECYCIFKC